MINPYIFRYIHYLYVFYVINIFPLNGIHINGRYNTGVMWLAIFVLKFWFRKEKNRRRTQCGWYYYSFMTWMVAFWFFFFMLCLANLDLSCVPVVAWSLSGWGRNDDWLIKCSVIWNCANVDRLICPNRFAICSKWHVCPRVLSNCSSPVHVCPSFLEY